MGERFCHSQGLRMKNKLQGLRPVTEIENQGHVCNIENVSEQHCQLMTLTESLKFFGAFVRAPAPGVK